MTGVTSLEIVVLSDEETGIPDVGITIVLLDVRGTEDTDRVLIPTGEVVNVLGVVVGADCNVDDSEVELETCSEDDKLILDDLSEE